MDRDTVVFALEELRPALEAEGVMHLSVFGSRARGDSRPDSDIDILLDTEPSRRFSILDLVGVEHLVRDATGIPANAFMRRSLDKSFLRSISPDSVVVF